MLKLKFLKVVQVFTYWILISLFLSGPVRAALRLEISYSLLVAIIVSLPVAILCCLRVRMKLSIGKLVVSAFFVAISSFLAFKLLYFAPFRGLVSVGGGDAGNHIHVIKTFFGRDPELYQGFVGFHTICFWLKNLASYSSFESFRIIFYGELLFLIILQLLCLGSLVNQVSVKEYFSLSLMLFLCNFYPAQKIFLPICHYLQGAGFYPHLFGFLVPVLFVLLLTYARDFIDQLFLVIVGAVLYRYTYGLNLGDFFIASAVLFLLRFSKVKRREEFYRKFIAILLFVFSFHCYKLLLPVVGMSGGIVKINIDQNSFGLLLISTGLFFAGSSSVRNSRNSDVEKVVFFIITFCLSSILAQYFFGYFVKDQGSYYVQKYLIHATLLVVFYAPVFCSIFLFELFHYENLKTVNLRKTLVSGVVLLLILIGFFQIKQAFNPYYITYLARVKTLIDPTLLQPLEDKIAKKKVMEILQVDSKLFGGFIMSNWGMSNFMNTDLGYYGELPLYLSGRVREKKNHCVFWFSDEIEMARYKEKNLTSVITRIQKLSRNSGVDHFEYVSAEENEARVLSWVCL